MSNFEKRTIEVEGISTGYLTGGAGGTPLVLLHGVGTSAGEWTWVLPALARSRLVYAIDLPGYDGSSEPSDYSPAFTARFIGAFLDAVGVDRAVVVGNSFGGLVALHLALCEPERVCGLVLVDSAGLGQSVNPTIVRLVLPGEGQLVAALEETPPGAFQRAFRRALLMFARPWQIPPRWLTDQYKVAQVRHFTETTRQSLLTVVGLMGQREVLLDRLPQLQMPTLIVWGIEDKVIPVWHATAAVTRLNKGSLKLIPSCGHLPHVEQPKRFVVTLEEFLRDQPR